MISDSEGLSSEKEWEVDSIGGNEVLNLKKELEQMKSENEVLKADKEKNVKQIESMMVSSFCLCIILPHIFSLINIVHQELKAQQQVNTKLFKTELEVKFIVFFFFPLLTMTYSMLISFACRKNRKTSSSWKQNSKKP